MIKNYTPYVKGDVITIDETLYDKLAKLGAIEIDGKEAKKVPFKQELTGRNIYGRLYLKNKVDIVIPTASQKDKQKIKLPKSRHINSTEIVVRRFSKEVGGFAKAVNDGAKLNQGRGEFVLILNDDAKLESGFFEAMIKSFRNKDVAIVGTKDSDRGDFINGSIMMVRREILERIGGLDEQYFFMWEDNDICENIKRRGYKIAVSQAPAKHEGARSMDSSSKLWQDNFYTGRDYYQKKWENKKRIVATMIVGNEEGRYLEKTINNLFSRKLIDEMVITIDAATDNTEKICRELAKKWTITIHVHKNKLFGIDESKLRERTHDYAISKNPYGIIPIDGDEILDDDVTRKKIEDWLDKGIGWDFYIAHFWRDLEKVRLDGLFGHQKNIRLYRLERERPQNFYDTPVHCGSAPIYAYENRRATDHLFKHYGYASSKDVDERIKRYRELDPNGYYESKNFYEQFTQEAITQKFNKKDFINNWKK